MLMGLWRICLQINHAKKANTVENRQENKDKKIEMPR